MQGYLADFAARFGVERLATPARMPNTRRALALAEHAREAGRLDAFREAAMAAYWEAGEDLELDAVLRQTAATAGLEPETALAAADDPRYLARIDAVRAEAAARGVRGIPTFFFGDQPPVVGCQPYEPLALAAERAGAERRR